MSKRINILNGNKNRNELIKGFWMNYRLKYTGISTILYESLLTMFFLSNLTDADCHKCLLFHNDSSLCKHDVNGHTLLNH